MNKSICVKVFSFIIFIIMVIVSINIIHSKKIDVMSSMINNNEMVNFKLLNEDGINEMYINANNDEVTLHLKVTPHLKKPCPAMFTIFMNGNQIKCLWNNEDHTENYYTTIEKDKISTIPIKISNIRDGMNTLHFGVAYYPEKYAFNSDERFSRKYGLDLTPFTIVCNDKEYWSQSNIVFSEYAGSLNPNLKEFSIGLYGDLISYSDKILQPNIEPAKIVYLWQNQSNIDKNMRLVLLRNWKQVPWPSGDMFIDTRIEPDEIFYKEIGVYEFINSNPTQLMVVAFANPNKSFWYFDNNKELRADPNGTQAYATLKKVFH